MLGYIPDKRDYFKGNLIDYYLKKGVSFSGGTQLHYEYFKEILQYSIINNTTQRALHDIRAGIFTLHLFPFKIKTLLSIAFYNYETSLLKEFKDCSLSKDNILLPSMQLQFNNIITGEYLAPEFLNLVDEVALKYTSFDVLKQYLNIQFNSTLDNLLLENIKEILELYNTSLLAQNDYLTLIINNDRLKAIVVTSKTLKYKQQSITYLTEALTKWHQTSNI